MQIYKIYINEKRLILHESKDVANLSYPEQSSLVMQYVGGSKKLLQAIDSLEKDSPYERIILHAEDFKKMKADLKSLFEIIKAGGGLVINELGEGLFIFRRGHWDLPKGKLDKGERIKDAAVREVQEETGVMHLIRGKSLIKTRHAYRTKTGRRVLKTTQWYHMTAPKQTLVPESKEKIEQAVWLKLDDFLQNKKPTFKSVTAVVHEYLKNDVAVVA